MGVSVAEGTIVEWKKAVGDQVARDEVIAAISTDKIDTDVEAPASGVLAEILVDVGETVEVGTVLARIGDRVAADGGGDGDGAANVTEARAALEAPGEAGELSGDTEVAHAGASAQQAAVPVNGGQRRRYSPVVMRIAGEHGIDLAQVPGTGRGGRVRKQDVLAFVAGAAAGAGAEPPPMHIESPYRPDEPAAPRARRSRLAPRDLEPAPAPAPAPVAAADGTHSAPLSRMRQSIGRHMLESLQTAATCTTVIEVDMSAVEAARARSGLTALPYVAQATVQALREYPALNATLQDDIVTTYDGVHLGIAVSLGEGGLIVPVIRDAQDLSPEGLARRIKDLARRARDNALTADEVRGGSFTITNPGGYGSIIATPVINQPQVAILDTEAIVKRAVVVTDALGNDAIAIRPMMYLCLSWDHRALDGALAAQFLAALKARLEAVPAG
jgi:pyruvate/2-oxoglutarate dehydrogenase complex dihydrolipoamide acyltransferase (E2) component